MGRPLHSYQKYSRLQLWRNRIITVASLLAVLAAVIFCTRGCKAEVPTDEQKGASESHISANADLVSSDVMEGEISEDRSDIPEDGSPKIGHDEDRPFAANQEASSIASASEESSKKTPSVYADSSYYEPNLPLLVNPTNNIPKDFVPDVAELGNGYKFDTHATAALNQMLEDGRNSGLSLWIISAYRSNESQIRNFNSKLAEYKALGYTEENAYAQTALYIAVPGTSEHSIGLATDLNSLEDSFENTAEFKWLFSNCADYGFILRYPKDKVDITKIAYEPWHYRYVGINHAKPIMEQGICLEEYLEDAETTE